MAGNREKIDARGIGKELSASLPCREAVRYFCRCLVEEKKIPEDVLDQVNARLMKNYPLLREIKTCVLKQGSVDFDELLSADSKKGEKPSYKTDCYIACYMDMHLRQNIETFGTYFDAKLFASKSVLFVDFGCGPMTAGLALVGFLSGKLGMKSYKKNIYYYGIDASENMCKAAKEINKKYELYANDRFEVIKGKDFGSHIVDDGDFDVAILNLSYVLSEGTFKVKREKQRAAVREFAESWHEYVTTNEACRNCEQTRIIYHNPRQNFRHNNWEIFCEEIKNLEGDMYEVGERECCNWQHNPLKSNLNPSDMAQIVGKRPKTGTKNKGWQQKSKTKAKH